jgi:hypothetical protein
VKKELEDYCCRVRIVIVCAIDKFLEQCKDYMQSLPAAHELFW